MDDGDEKAGLFRVYKTALAGTLFARVGMTNDCESAANKLQTLQNADGGWVTDLDSTAKSKGVANIETACLALICLDCADKGGASVTI